MTEPDRESLIHDRLLADAAGWFARMRGPEADARRGAFEAWLAHDARHRSAYNRAAEVFALGKWLADEPMAAPATAPATRPRTHLPLAAAAIALLCMLMLAAWPVLRPDFGGRTADLVTDAGHSNRAVILAAAPGETRRVRLVDGSVLTLAADTRVVVELEASVRALRLERGRARFAVAHEARPFIVHAGGGSVVARGTVFEVGLSAARRVSVHLIEGAVDVRYPLSSSGGPDRVGKRRLRAGETVGFAASRPSGIGANSVERHLDLGSPTPAAQATRDYEDVTVAQLVRVANDGAARPIRLAVPTIGDRRVAGRFRIGDTELLADRIAALFHLTVDRRDSREIVLRPA
jgi:transmembrane sensor